MTQYASSEAGQESDSSLGPPRRVLLVDDDIRMREVLDDALQGWSFATSLAGTFREAREVVLAEPPFAVIVSDYHLPDGNGLEFHDWLRRELLLAVPFLLISGGMLRTPSPADDYEFLAKPFRLQQFRDRVETLSRAPQPAVRAFNLTIAQEALASVYARSKPRPDARPGGRG